MSVIPLSSVTPPEGSPAAEPAGPKPGSFDNEKFDKAFAAVEKQVEALELEPAPPGPRRSLDAMLSENIDKFEKTKADEEAFERALPARDDLRSHYEHLGGLDTTLKAFFMVYDAIRSDPVRGAEKAIEAFSEASFLSDIAAKKKPDRTVPEDHLTDPHDRRYSGLALDRAIELAMEKHGIDDQVGIDKKDAITPQMRQRLDAIMPGLPLDRQLEVISDFNRAAIKDPYQGVAKLAVTLGLPTTPS
jgi:hypothetical protein